jgi:glycosyltransferase involved in cell wall biosynthesis/8-oxo-dGTP pyrophosphatase MutT (NUDIX family)
MKIAILSPWAVKPDSIGGTERYVLDLAGEMAKKGHTVDVITLGGDNYNHGGIHFISLELVNDINEYSLEKFAVTTNNSILESIAEKIEDKIQFDNYDVIQLNSLLFIELCPNKRRVITLHTNPFEAKMQFGEKLYDNIIGLLRKQVKNTNLRIVAQSKYYTKLFSRLLSGYVYYIPHIIDLDRIHTDSPKYVLRNKYNLDQYAKICLLPSRLELKQKRPQIAIRAVSQLDKKLRDKIILIFCGIDNQYKVHVNKLKQLAAKSGVPARFIRFEHMKDAYGLADFVILPSKSESLGLSALESLGLEIPTILNSIPTFKEIAEGNQNAHLFGNSSKSLTALLRKLITNNTKSYKSPEHWVKRFFDRQKWAWHYETLLSGDEFRELFDGNRRRTEELVVRHEPIPAGKYYVTVFSWIVNSSGKLLLQFTSPEKGGKWGATGGHPKAGESSAVGLINEVKEELGFDITKRDFVKLKTIKTEDDFVDVYLIKRDFNIDGAVLQKEEVVKIAWFSKKEVQKLIEDGKFLEPHIDFFNNFIELMEKEHGEIN